MSQGNRIARVLGNSLSRLYQEKGRLQGEYSKEKDEMDILFNRFKHTREIYAYGREIMGSQ